MLFPAIVFYEKLNCNTGNVKIADMTIISICLLPVSFNNLNPLKRRLWFVDAICENICAIPRFFYLKILDFKKTPFFE